MRTLVLIILVQALCGTIYSQDEWELQKEDEGIKVYLSEVEGSKLKAYKVVALMDGKLSQFVAVLKDVNNYPELFTNNAFSEILDISDTSLIYYNQTAVPWPISDRDGVFEMNFSQRYDLKMVRVDIETIDGLIKPKDGFVRVEKAIGHWLFHPVDSNKIEVSLEMHAEPGGNIPSWVINMFIVDNPLKDFKNLREIVKLEKYKNQKFDFLVDN